MESIDSLTSVVQKMEASFSFWHDWSNWLIVITIIAGACLYFFQYKANETAILLGKAKDKLSEESIAQVKAEADKQIALLNADAVKAKSEIAKAQAQAAQANEKAESERLARVQLEARLADRKLTTEQQARLIASLRPFSGTEVDVVILGDTSEIRMIGMVILDCLQKADWIVNSGNAIGGVSIVKGILVGVRSGSNMTIADAARTFASGLQSMGIDSGPWDFDQLVERFVIKMSYRPKGDIF